jgi:predicted transporter
VADIVFFLLSASPYFVSGALNLLISFTKKLGMHSRYANVSLYVIRGNYFIFIFFLMIGIYVVQNIVHYLMDFVFGRLLIRALAHTIVLITFMVFPIRCGIYYDPTWAKQLPTPLPPVRGLLVSDR